MLEKLLELILGAKSGALSGVLIVAGAVVTVTGGNGVTTITVEHPSPSPIALAPPQPAPSPLEKADPSKPPQVPPEGSKEREQRRVSSPPAESCDDEAHARSAARQKVQAAFSKYHAALEQLRKERNSSRAAETLKKADALLREIAEKADRILKELGRCPHHDDEDRDEDEDDAQDEDRDENDEGETVSAASRVEADSLTMQQVAERAVAAMETVYNLAKGAAEATPTPKPTEKPRPRATPKPSRTPGCDDRIHASKKQLAASFERFHSANDRLLKEVASFAGERTLAALKAADKVMHQTYDSSRDAILKAGCADAAGARVAADAAGMFERAYLSAKAAVSAEVASRR